jgi:hypothetical protein
MKVTVNNLEKEETIDWNKVQLVVSDNGNIVFSNQSTSTEHFEGICLERGDSCNKNGSYSKLWVKSMFKPFHGSIKLQND